MMKPGGARTRALIALALLTGALAWPSGAAHAAQTPDCAAAGVVVTGLGGPNFYIDSGATPEFRSGYTGYRISNATGAALDDVWAGLGDFTGGALGLAPGQAAAQRVGDLSDGGALARFWYLTAGSTNANPQNHKITVYQHNPALPNAVVLCTSSGGFSSVQGTLSASANKVTGISVTGAAPRLGSVFTVSVDGTTGTIGQGITGDAYSLWMTPAVAETWPADAFRLVGTSLTISSDGTAPQSTYRDTLRVAGLGTSSRPYTATYTFQAVGFSAAPTTVKPVQEIASGTQVKHTGSYSVELPAIQPAVNDLSLAIAASNVKVGHGGGTVTVTGTVSGTAGAEIDGFALALPAGATIVPGSSTWGGTGIADPVTSGGRRVYSGPFVVGPKRLSLEVSFDATPGDRTITGVGTVGSAQIGSAATPTDGSNPAGVTVNVDTAPTAGDTSVTTVPNTPVTVNVATLAADTDADEWTISGTSPAGHGTVSVTGRLVTYHPDEDYQGPDSFTYTVDDGRGGTATGTVAVTVDPEATPPDNGPFAQLIDFAAPDGLEVGDTTPLSATATSGLPVSFQSTSPQTCTVADGQVTAVAPGECSVLATQDGDPSWSPAPPVLQTFAVTEQPAPVELPADPEPASQAITFGQPDPVTAGQAFTVHPSADSGLPVSVVSDTPEVCTLQGDLVVTTAVGECVLVASQPGDATHAAATPVARTVTVSAAQQPEPDAPLTQAITFGPTPSLLGLDDYTLDAEATSGLPVSFTALQGPCTVTGRTLAASAAGECVLQATQPGDATYAAADPVTRTVAFVVPGDDEFSAAGAVPVTLDVLDNDPAGVDLDRVEDPAHGTAAIVGGAVVYTPDPSFRGTEQFRYVVTHGTRSASAEIRVVVANQAPTLPGDAVVVRAGEVGAVLLAPRDANGDELTLSAHSSSPSVSTAVRGRTLVIAPDATASGDVTVAVAVSDGHDGWAAASVAVRVLPPAPTGASRSLSPAGTRVSWTAAPTAGASYEVAVDGRPVCRTSTSVCAFEQVAGPTRAVSVRTLGRDATSSPWTDVSLRGHGEVLVTTLYFASGSATLTPTDRRILTRAIGKVRRYGFARVSLAGYTDADGGYRFNLALSKRRTAAVASYVRDHGRLGSVQSWHGESDPVASNGAPQGKARNRRVEVIVRY